MLRRLFPRRHESSDDSPLSTMKVPWDVHNAGFRAKECTCFVPLPWQKPGTDIQRLRCHCGERLNLHADFREPGAERENVIQNLVPQELQDLCAPDRWERMAPEPLPDISVPWSKANFRTTLTNACGKMTFSSARNVKPAKYIRVSDEDSVQKVWMFLKDKWKIMNPKPDLVISVVGGAKNYRLDEHKGVFENGLLKMAETTQPLIITSGFNVGVMKAVGQIMKQGQSYNIRNKKIAHSIRCLGIAPWGFVQNRFDIEKLSFTSEYNMTAWSMDDFQPVPLNPHHTHFVLVDNGFRNRFTDCGNISQYRADLEVRMNLESPVVLVVVEGGLSVLSDIQHSLSGGIPVVICKGTGRAADLVSYAFARSDENGSMSEEYEEKVRKYLMKLYGNTWRDPDEKEKQINNLRSILLECLRMKKLITIFDVDGREGLDYYVLKALFQGARNWGRDRRLDLAISLNRPDFAEKELFGENAFWEVEALQTTLETCILRDMDGFVRVILQEENMDIKRFLTPGRLQDLYTKASVEDGLLVSLLDRGTINLRRGEETDGREIALNEIGRVLDDLLDQYDKDVYKKTDPTLQTPVQDPFLQLFIWAVLNERKTMATVFWEYVEAPVATALLGSWLYTRMSRRLGARDQQWSNQLLEAKRKMEMLAVDNLNEMRARYPKQAADYVAKDTPLWGPGSATCLQMAAAAEDKMFLSSPTCQAMFKKEWEGEVKMGLLRIFLCLPLAIFLPFLVHVWGSFSLRFNHKSWTSKVAEFLWSPRVKFMCYIISYLVFLMMFSYMVLFDVQQEVSNLEWACGVFALAILMDELHRLISIPALSTKSRIMLWRGWLYLLFVLSLVAALIALVYHAATRRPKGPKQVYSVVCVLFILRILRFYIASKHLGPKLHIIRKTLRPLGMFGLITLVFLLAYGVPAQALMYQKRSFHLGVFWDLLLVPYWQIYGELQLDDFSDDVACLERLSDANHTDSDTMLSCRQHSRLVPILFAVYLLFANVLLINLIIAIFTKIFETVERSSILIWKYQMYFFIKEYAVKSILPAPFSLVEDVFRIGRHTVRLCRQRGAKPPALGRDETLHLRWVERQVTDRFLRKSKEVEALSADKSLLGIQKSIGALQSILLSDIGLFTSRKSEVMRPTPQVSAHPTPILTRRERLRELIHKRYSHARAMQVASTEFLPLPKRDAVDENSDKDEVDGASSSYSDSESEFIPKD